MYFLNIGMFFLAMVYCVFIFKIFFENNFNEMNGINYELYLLKDINIIVDKL